MRISPLVLVFLLDSVIALPAARAAGFGATPSSTSLGSPLAIMVPLRVDEGDAVEPECVSAEVLIGDRRVQPFNVRTLIEPGATPRDRLVRVATLVTVDEPVVTVQVSAGCSTRITRRFTLFADPPLFVAAPTAVTEVAQRMQAAPPTASRPDELPRPVVDAPAARVKPAAAPVSRAAPIPRRVGATVAQRGRKAGAQSTAPRAVARAAAPRPRLTLVAPLPSKSEASTLLAGGAASAVAAAPQAIQAAGIASAAGVANVAAGIANVASASTAATAASGTDAATAATTQRVQALESQVERLVADSRQQHSDNQQLRGRLAGSVAAGGWLPWLGALLAILLAAVLWLGWRLRRMQRAQAQWWKASQLEALASPSADRAADRPADRPADRSTDSREHADTTAVAHDHGRGAAAQRPVQRLVQPTAAASAVNAPSSAPPTAAEPVSLEPGWTTVTPPRPVSAEELIDLEQQAEFFVVLGQDDAAIDLLVGHIRNSGGISPLPYLKLLEIYRRRGEVESYERTRARFNLRFNAYAPEWDADLQSGRSLDAYAEVMALLQKAWPRPLDAMAELESLLFRKDGGQLFDLPAYRELLLLYALARDLLDDEAQAITPVDLLLPLEARATARAAPNRGAIRTDDTQSLGADVSMDRPTAPAALAADLRLDLDLDLGRLGELNSEITRPGAFTELGANHDSRLADLPSISAVPASRKLPPRGRRS